MLQTIDINSDKIIQSLGLFKSKSLLSDLNLATTNGEWLFSQASNAPFSSGFLVVSTMDAGTRFIYQFAHGRNSDYGKVAYREKRSDEADWKQWMIIKS